MSRRNQELIKELSIPPPGYQDLSFPTKYAQNFLNQCMANTWKQFRSYWKNPPYNAMRYLMTILYGLVFGSVFWRMGKNVYDPTLYYDIRTYYWIVFHRLPSMLRILCVPAFVVQEIRAGTAKPTWSHLCCCFLPWICKLALICTCFFYRKDSLLP
jgi:hypothetical protein